MDLIPLSSFCCLPHAAVDSKKESWHAAALHQTCHEYAPHPATPNCTLVYSVFVYVYLIPAPLILINFDGISQSQYLFVLHKVFLPVLSLKSTKQICILYKFTFHFVDCSLLHMTILYVWSLFLLDKGIGFRWEKKRIRMTVSSDSIYWDKFVREVNGNNIFIWKHGHVNY